MASKKTTLTMIYKDAHSALKLVSALTGEPMVKLLDGLIVEQMTSLLSDPTSLSDVAKEFLDGRKGRNIETSLS